jgi:hypothetical protein
LRLGRDRFILQNIPLLGEQAVGYADDIGGDPILQSSSHRPWTIT